MEDHSLIRVCPRDRGVTCQSVAKRPSKAERSGIQAIYIPGDSLQSRKQDSDLLEPSGHPFPALTLEASQSGSRNLQPKVCGSPQT